MKQLFGLFILLPCLISIALEPIQAGTSAAIARVIPDLANLHKWDASNGDTWDPFWADDDNLYSFNCDGRGFGPHGRNLAFNEFTGPALDQLSGKQINPMDEYGRSGFKEADGATWKVCGQECIDGIFYGFVCRNIYGNAKQGPAHAADLVQREFNQIRRPGRDVDPAGGGKLRQPHVAGQPFWSPGIHSLRKEWRECHPGRRRPLRLRNLEQRLLERRRLLHP